MKKKICLSCNEELIERWQYKFCSNQCQADYRYKNFLNTWLIGNKNVLTVTISGHIRRYLKEKGSNKCSECGWNKIHQITKVVPLEVDHRDGNADNNVLNNLRLLCPNCHALTPSFRNLNKGNGRVWRRKKHQSAIKHLGMS